MSQRLVQRGGTLGVAAARCMHQCPAQCHPCAYPQCRIAMGIGIDDGFAQTLRARLQRTSADRSLASFDLRPGARLRSPKHAAPAQRRPLACPLRPACTCHEPSIA
jgi:hypothetical protein